MAFSSADFHCRDDFDAVLVIFCSYHYDVNASEVDARITTDEKDYHKCSLPIIICIATAYKYSRKGCLLGHFVAKNCRGPSKICIQKL